MHKYMQNVIVKKRVDVLQSSIDNLGHYDQRNNFILSDIVIGSVMISHPT